MNNDIYDYLKFKLDDEYSDYEFQVIPIPPYEIIENNLSIELYEYFGEIDEVLNLRVKHIILYFNADILMKVELRYRGNKLELLKQRLEKLNNIQFSSIIFLKLYFSEKDRETVLTYQKKDLVTHL